MAKIKATFFLPLRDNDGTNLAGLIQEVERRLFNSFGAFTKIGHFKGEWRMETGERKLDVTAVYMLFLDEARLPELVEILQEFKASTTQEAILLEGDRDVDLMMI